jgi:hypothetical protein
MTFRRKTDVLGRFSHDHAYAWAHQTSGSAFTLILTYQYNTQLGDLAIARLGPGLYSVTAPNQGNSGGHVQVTAYGSGPERCKVGKWDVSGVDQAIEVRCFNATGIPADSQFTLSYIGGDVPYIPIQPVCLGPTCPQPKP